LRVQRSRIVCLLERQEALGEHSISFFCSSDVGSRMRSFSPDVVVASSGISVPSHPDCSPFSSQSTWHGSCPAPSCKTPSSQKRPVSMSRGCGCALEPGLRERKGRGCGVEVGRWLHSPLPCSPLMSQGFCFGSIAIPEDGRVGTQASGELHLCSQVVPEGGTRAI